MLMLKKYFNHHKLYLMFQNIKLYLQLVKLILMKYNLLILISTDY